ncbi:type VI secretion system ImpA family N-terminal domain-containing protein [Belnapia sp. T6]|uniref:Type VI secretion system ImpA family N-terminal domain-containing protein n=1 Tax=Belnapia mucosa TaxID=2804532 RepID=A0ABS1VBX8_9PROT|nr:type VI secretion system ImpA family N-terminal domain-containing protein [Belnapia mucosa]MBL6458646.1 type VI secretion system ImpA family N-terminal domain-containing protein [Belnapia mucosa]
MPFDPAALLAPVSDAWPCGEALDDIPAAGELRALASSPQRANWSRQLERAVALAARSRDLRAWIWLARAALGAEGVAGLAAGLRLIADGLQRYWEILPPQHADEADPRERFMARLSALTQLGVTNFGCSLDQILGSGRTVIDLRADLEAMAAAAAADEATRHAAAEARAAIADMSQTFAARFGPGRDPQLGFEVLAAGLAALEARLAAGGGPATAGPPAAAAAGAAAAPTGGQTLRSLASREEVVRALDLVLDYYASHEPSSPVPLLVGRAKRLVPLSFLDAIRDLAPGGLRELQAVTGVTDGKD